MKIHYLIAILILFSCNTKEVKPDQEIGDVQETQLLQAIGKYPDSSLLKETLMQHYRDINRHDKAIAMVNNALGSDSLNDRLWDIKGILHLENDDTLGAIHAYENAIDISANPVYVIALGTLYAQVKNESAIIMADGLLHSKDPYAERHAYFIKGLYYTYSGQKEKAILFFDKCLALSYTDMDAYLEKSIALYDLGKYEFALQTLDKALTLQNNFETGHYYRGRCLEKLNRKIEASQAYKTALMYDPQYTEAIEALAKLGG